MRFRYLSSVVPGYFQRLDAQVQKRVYREGGMLSPDEQFAFANSRYFANAMRLSVGSKNEPSVGWNRTTSISLLTSSNPR